MAVLLDTNVVSELRKVDADPQVLRWYESVPESDLYISVLVIGEIRQGIDRLMPRDSRRGEALDGWLETLVRGYADRILPVSAEVADRWGKLSAVRPLPAVDALMAATALVHGLTLATRNVRHVQHTGVVIVDPFVP